MKRLVLAVCFLILSVTCGVAAVPAQGKDKSTASVDTISALVGNWSGESVCVDRERFPACHDEQVVYRIVKSDDKPETLHITMDKIVDGKPELMDEFDFKYDDRAHALVAEFTRHGRRGVWEFKVNGDVIEGSLVTLPEKKAARRVRVKKEQATRPT